MHTNRITHVRMGVPLALGRPPSTFFSSGGILIELWSKGIDENIDRDLFDNEYLTDFVDSVLEEMTSQMSKIQIAYGQLKTDLTVPTRFKQ